MQKVRHDLANDLRNLRAGSRGAFIVISERIARMGSQISGASKEAARELQREGSYGFLERARLGYFEGVGEAFALP